MTLKEKIKADFKEAFKAKEEVKLSVLKMVNAAIGNAEIEKRAKIIKSGGEATEAAVSLNDEEVLRVVSREIKKRKDSIEIYEKAGRAELAEREKAEASVLSAYMPEQLGESEVRELAKKSVEQSGAKGEKEIGKVMAILMPQVKGKADGATVTRIVKELLS
ncbi:MAG: GatB/YqeY domain-containing protein [Candidatus Pacebacteria bacterium]|nr:GatB/YqeY domain-containing protein [Candidatus Paceibacterota bacterium]NUQ57159.1 GatB/YqeY domain-containing protein [Candidatus Paceibacter sp.]